MYRSYAMIKLHINYTVTDKWTVSENENMNTDLQVIAELLQILFALLILYIYKHMEEK